MITISIFYEQIIMTGYIYYSIFYSIHLDHFFPETACMYRLYYAIIFNFPSSSMSNSRLSLFTTSDSIFFNMSSSCPSAAALFAYPSGSFSQFSFSVPVIIFQYRSFLSYSS